MSNKHYFSIGKNEGFKPSKFTVDLNSAKKSEVVPSKRQLWWSKVRHRISDRPVSRNFLEVETHHDVEWDMGMLRRIKESFISFLEHLGRKSTVWPAIFFLSVFYFIYKKIRRIFWFARCLSFVRRFFTRSIFSLFRSAILQWRMSLPVARVVFQTAIEAEVVKERHQSPRRSVAYFVLAVIVLVMPVKIFAYYKSLDIDGIKSTVMGSVKSAIASIKDGGMDAKGLEFTKASENFQAAGAHFLRAEEELGRVNDALLFLAKLAPDNNIRLAASSKYILESGRLVSELGVNISRTVDDSLIETKSGNWLEAVKRFEVGLGQAVYLTDALIENISAIDAEALPIEYQDKFREVRIKSQAIATNLKDAVAVTRLASEFIGNSKNKKYLLVFQNNTEARATGGFIGSYALIDFRNGRLYKVEVPGGGSYDMTAGFKEFIEAPEPMHVVSPRWFFWDANWWPDWPKSAKKLALFYEKSDGPTVDGVISLTPSVLEDLLRVIGPIDMRREYGVELTSDNFYNVMQSAAENKATNTPKRIVGDVMDKIFKVLPEKMDRQTMAKLIGLMQDSMAEKHVLVYLKDVELESKVKELGWDGSIIDTKYDYLQVVNTNLRGGKSDRVVQEDIKHKADILSDGSIEVSLEIRRTHNGAWGDEFTGVPNVDWMRIYVPAGAKLLSANGFERPIESFFEKGEGLAKDADLMAENNAEIDPVSQTKIYDELGKTVFANWMIVRPGSSATVYLRYRLPFKMHAEELPQDFWSKLSQKMSSEQPLAPYSLVVQKQLGAKPSSFSSYLSVDRHFVKKYQYPELENQAAINGWTISEALNKDKYWVVGFSR